MVAVPPLTQSVLEFIHRQKLLKAGDRAAVAVSGGADSVALLRLLIELRPELGIVLSVVHFNHKLRGADSEADEQFVAELAHAHKIEFQVESGDVSAYAAQKRRSTETAAREMRHEFFVRWLRDGRCNRIATAHTLDDQAETVLLKLVRGAGTRGLAGIYPRFSVDGSQLSDTPGIAIVRPFLGTRRRDLEVYLRDAGQTWREDKSNRDLRYSRNLMRHGVLPRLERNLNPAVREALAETAEIARAEEQYWASEVGKVLPQVCAPGSERILKLAALAPLPLALQRRAIRAVAESLGLRLEFRHVEEILEVASASPHSAKSAMLPHGWVASRTKTELCFESAAAKTPGLDYEYSLPLPGKVKVPEAGAWFEAVLVPRNAEQGYNRQHLFDPALLAQQLAVRNWRAGDRFWPAHTKAPKKLKELLQERHVSEGERKTWPVVVSGTEVIWVRGFPAPARLGPRDQSEQVVAIRELPLAEV